MTIIRIFAALLIETLVVAQTLPPDVASTGTLWITPPQRLFTSTVNGMTVTVTATPSPKCEDGWLLVMTEAMQPMCARELKKPIE